MIFPYTPSRSPGREDRLAESSKPPSDSSDIALWTPDWFPWAAVPSLPGGRLPIRCDDFPSCERSSVGYTAFAATVTSGNGLRLLPRGRVVRGGGAGSGPLGGAGGAHVVSGAGGRAGGRARKAGGLMNAHIHQEKYSFQNKSSLRRVAGFLAR